MDTAVYAMDVSPYAYLGDICYQMMLAIEGYACSCNVSLKDLEAMVMGSGDDDGEGGEGGEGGGEE